MRQKKIHGYCLEKLFVYSWFLRICLFTILLLVIQDLAALKAQEQKRAAVAATAKQTPPALKAYFHFASMQLKVTFNTVISTFTDPTRSLNDFS